MEESSESGHSILFFRGFLTTVVSEKISLSGSHEIPL
jgi:hypothetical protein